MKKVFSLLLVLAFALSLTSVALAQAPGQGIGIAPEGGTDIGSTGSITGTASLVEAIMGLVNWFAWFIGLAAVAMGLYAGILFITAGGGSAKVVSARKILLFAIFGIAGAIPGFRLVAISKSIFTL